MHQASSPERKAYIITGPTSGIGRATALELAKHGTIIMVGRDRRKLDEMHKLIESKGQHAVSVICDMSDIASVRRAAADILALKLPIAALINNAGMMSLSDSKNAAGWDLSFVTNHLGPFALTEALVPNLADGTNVIFVCSAVEDPDRAAAKQAGFRGGRYISAEASLRGQWTPGGSPVPGFIPNSNLGREANCCLIFLAKCLAPLLAPCVKIMSSPARAGRLLTNIATDTSTAGRSGRYYGETGGLMESSESVRDFKFCERVVAETRALLAGIAAPGGVSVEKGQR